MAGSQPPALRRGWFESFEALHPGKSPDRLTVGVTHDRVRALSKGGMALISELSEIVPTVLSHPKHVFEGIRWDEDDDKFSDADGWRCYVGIPRFAFKNNPKDQSLDPTRMPPWPDQVFLVFINTEGVAYNWRWEKCDPDDTTRPARCDGRFHKEVYPHGT